jgi:hypothetical protein
MRTLVRRAVPFKARRAWWRVRRSVPRVAQPLSLLVRVDAPARPILIVGCPRSGTTILLHILRRSGALCSVQSEGHILWQPYHHPRDRGWDSDALDVDDLSDRERHYIYLAVRIQVGDRRFLDKTPENCLRIPYLRALFPDASIVFLRRRAAENVNSLMEGWRARPRFVTYRLPLPLEGLGRLNGNRWSFLLIPGWRDLRSLPLEEICAHQYIACNEAVLDARSRIDFAQWLDVSYEDLTSDPVATVRWLFENLALDFTPEVQAFAENLTDRPGSTALTPPQPDKWRHQNPSEIERILPLVARTERRLGW